MAVFAWLVVAPEAQTQYFPPAGAWEKRAPADLGMDPAKLAEAVAFAQSRESRREMDFSDQERIFGSLLGSVPTRRATTNACWREADCRGSARCRDHRVDLKKY